MSAYYVGKSDGDTGLLSVSGVKIRPLSMIPWDRGGATYPCYVEIG